MEGGRRGGEEGERGGSEKEKIERVEGFQVLRDWE